MSVVVYTSTGLEYGEYIDSVDDDDAMIVAKMLDMTFDVVKDTWSGANPDTLNNVTTP